MNELIQYYKRDLKIYNIILKKTGINLRWKLNVFLGLVIASSFSTIIFQLIKTDWMKWSVLILVIITVLTLLYLNYNLKKSAKLIFKINVDSFLWNTKEVLEAFDKHKLNELEKYIHGKNISVEELKLIKKQLDEYIFESKPKFPYIPSFVFVLLTIYTEKFTGAYIEVSKIITSADFYNVLFNVGLVFLLVIIYIIVIYYVVIKGIIYDLMSSNYEQCKRLKKLLEQLEIKNIKKRYMFFE